MSSGDASTAAKRSTAVRQPDRLKQGSITRLLVIVGLMTLRPDQRRRTDMLAHRNGSIRGQRQLAVLQNQPLVGHDLSPRDIRGS